MISLALLGSAGAVSYKAGEVSVRKHSATLAEASVLGAEMPSEGGMLLPESAIEMGSVEAPGKLSGFLRIQR